MGKFTPPTPVKPIFGVLYRDAAVFEEALKRIEGRFGPIDYLSEPFPFVETDYYRKEMGENLVRRYLSLQNLISPEKIAEFKIVTNRWEEEWTENGSRRINLDPGYMALQHLALLSTKPFSHRIYLGQGIYAEVTMIYQKDGFAKLPWTYADYYNHRDVLQEIRRNLKAQLRRGGELRRE
ncbi:MAG: DUF4416 family protein [Candidatus Omnitrophota bacterium]